MVKLDRFQKDYWEEKKPVNRRSAFHPVVQTYVLSRINALIPHIIINSDSLLLDVGCGNGFFTAHFDKLCKVTGIDYSKGMLELNPVKNTFQMEAENIEFKDNSFDIVFCHSLLHHIENIDRVLTEMRRVSRKYVIVLEPNRNNPLMFLFSALVKEERKATKFSINYLRKILSANKLKIIESFAFGTTVPNKTPLVILPILHSLDIRYPFGMTNILIAEKV